MMAKTGGTEFKNQNLSELPSLDVKDAMYNALNQTNENSASKAIVKDILSHRAGA
jgi:hypothetical protein